ncbi:MAG: hypothetical protein H0W54_00975 [Rubrobacter sp.]|nr:hypothetical protein [Rubrobacter sp.]
MEQASTIEVLIVEPQLIVESEEPIPGRRMFPDTRAAATRIVNIPVASLKEAIQNVSTQIEELTKDIPAIGGLTRLDEITVSLQVSADGGIRWVAGIGASVSGVITLTFRIPSSGERD